MKKNTVLWFVGLLLAANVQAQPKPASPSGGVPRSTTGAAARTDTSSLRTPLDVLFATNEDCDLFINGQPNGSVTKTEFRYLKLAPGTYRYTARSRRSGQEWSDSFTVTEGGLNEVFMDVLYATEQPVVQNAAQRNSTAATTQKPSSKKTTVPVLQKPSADKAAIETVINLLVTNTAFVGGGSFIMGNNRAPAADEAEHTATIRPVYFGKYEVTQHQWETIMGSNPSLNKACPTCPVDNVSWEEVAAFIQNLNALSKKNFRLPTEAEWEYVAKLGGKAAVDAAGGQEAYIKKTAWFFSNAGGRPHPVGLLQADVSGVYDLTGNVSEWCLDWYDPLFYRTEAGRNNPQGPATGKLKVVRGGNFKDYVGDRFRPSFRGKREPKHKSSEIGFRLVLDAADQ